jgi:hypothetical protein
VRKRTLSLLLAGTFLFGTAAACSDDEDPAETDTTESDSGDEGGDGGDAGGAGEAYCAEVEEFVALAQEDPANPDLATQAQELSAAAAEITDPEQAQIAADCAADIAEALTPG